MILILVMMHMMEYGDGVFEEERTWKRDNGEGEIVGLVLASLRACNFAGHFGLFSMMTV